MAKVESGGSANLYGVLYQSLRYLQHAGSVVVRQAHTDGESNDQYFILEPPGGGGDAQYITKAGRVVEQIKASSEKTAWSLSALVDKVLPDLYLAVPDIQPQTPEHYRFTTEGHRGKWAAAESFFASLRQFADNDKIFDESDLDDLVDIGTIAGSTVTRKSLFEAVRTSCQKRSGDSGDKLQGKVVRLLASFRIRPNVLHADVHRKLNRFFARYADNPDDTQTLIDAAIGNTIRRASKTGICLTPKDFLREFGLTDRPFSLWRAIKSSAFDASNRKLYRHGYRPELDVRESPFDPTQLASQHRVWIVSGESGQGNTWQSGKLLQATARQSKSLVVWTAAGESSETTLRTISSQVWGEAMQRFGNTPNIEQLARLKREQTNNGTSPWMTVIIDDVKSLSIARGLADQDWATWDVCVVIFTTPSIARSLQLAFPGVTKHGAKVRDFSDREVRRLLEIHELTPFEHPNDLLALIKRPIAASLYCQLATTSEWVPKNEYEICHRFWQRLREANNQPEHLSDLKPFRDLSLSLLNNAPYPWDLETQIKYHLSDDVRNRLEQVGWLVRPDNDGNVAIWHDRLVNWAVAEAIVNKRRTQRRLHQDEKKGFLSDVSQAVALKKSRKSSQFGYVFGDVLWLLLNPSQSVQATGLDIADAAAVIAEADDREGYGHWCERNYTQIVATLGSSSIPILSQRLEDSASLPVASSSMLPQYIAKTMIKIAKHDAEACEFEVCGWLENGSDEKQKSAVHYLAKRPTRNALEKLWSLHRSTCFEMTHNESRDRPFHLYSLQRQAISACLTEDEDWLMRRILSRVSSDPIEELFLFLAFRPGGRADAIWPDVRNASILGPNPVLSHAYTMCLRRFKDATRINDLEKAVTQSEDPRLPGLAICALAVIQPKILLKSLQAVKPFDAYLFRNDWVPLVHLGDSEIARDTRKIIAASASPQSLDIGLSDCYQGYEDFIDQSVLAAVISVATKLLEKQVDGEIKPNTHPLTMPLGLLSNANSLACINFLRSLKESDFEKVLAEACIGWSRSRHRGYHHSDLNRSLDILLKIGGQGYTRVINEELRSPPGQKFQIGTQWAPMIPNDETLELLNAICIDFQSIKAVSKNEDLDAGSAIQALFATHQYADGFTYLGSNRSVSFIGHDRALLPSGCQLSDNDLSLLVTEFERDRLNSWPWMQMLGETQMPEAARLIRKTLREIGPSHPLAKTALMALSNCGHSDASDIELAKRFFSNHECFAEVINVLLAADRDVALRETSERITEVSFQGRNRLLAWLCSSADGREILLDSLVDLVIDDPHPMTFEDVAKIIGYSDRPDIGDRLRTVIFSQPFRMGATADALQGLALHDPGGAFDAATEAWNRWSDDRHRLPKIFLQIDTTRGMNFLIQKLPSETLLRVRKAIGRALRLLANQEALLNDAAMLLQHQDDQSRAAGADIIGWLPPDEVSQLIDMQEVLSNEKNVDVKLSILNAIRQMRRDSEVDLLIQDSLDFPGTAFVSLRAAIRLSDPWFAFDFKDPVGLRKAIDPLSDLQHFLLQKEVKKVEESFEKRWKKQERDLA